MFIPQPYNRYKRDKHPIDLFFRVKQVKQIITHSFTAIFTIISPYFTYFTYYKYDKHKPNYGSTTD